jgi:hypothetical protein
MNLRPLSLAASGVAVLALAALAAVPNLLRPPAPSAVVEPITVSVPAADRTLVCPEPIRSLIPGTEGDQEFSSAPAGSMSVTAVTVQALAPAAPIQLRPLGGEPIATAADVTTPAAVLATTIDTELLLTGQMTSPLSAAIAGTAITSTPSGDLCGLSAASCQSPALEHWLVGADTTADSSTRLVVVNPSAVAVTLEVEIFGAAGQVLDVPRTIAVAPQASQSLLLESVAPGESALVVHVTSSGRVATWLQTSRTRGLMPAGIDYVVPGAPPGTNLLLGPLPAADSQVDDPDVATLRLLATQDTTATVRLLGPDGPIEVPGLNQVDLDGGAVLDIGLGGIPANPYIVQVSADAPIVAGAMAVDLSDDDSIEIAWAPASNTAALDASGVIAIPPNVVAYLVATLDGPQPVAYRLRLLQTDGALQSTATLTLQPDVVAVVPLTGGEPVAAVAVDQPDEGAAGQVLWSVLLLDAANQDLFSTVQPTGYPAGESTVRVWVE